MIYIAKNIDSNKAIEYIEKTINETYTTESIEKQKNEKYYKGYRDGLETVKHISTCANYENKKEDKQC